MPLDLVELHERDRREHVAEVRLVAGNRDVVERAVAAAHHAKVVERRREVVAVGRDQPALARGDVLRRVEREAGQVGDRADLASAVAGLGRVRRVLDERQAELAQRIEVGRLPVEIDRDDRLGPLVDERTHVLGIDVQRVVADVGEDGRRAAVDDHVGGRRPGDRAGDHLVAGPDPERDEREVAAAAVQDETASTWLRLEVVAHPRLELGRPRPRRQPARAEGRRDSVDLLLGDRRWLEREKRRSFRRELRHPRSRSVFAPRRRSRARRPARATRRRRAPPRPGRKSPLLENRRRKLVHDPRGARCRISKSLGLRPVRRSAPSARGANADRPATYNGRRYCLDLGRCRSKLGNVVLGRSRLLNRTIGRWNQCPGGERASTVGHLKRVSRLAWGFIRFLATRV